MTFSPALQRIPILLALSPLLLSALWERMTVPQLVDHSELIVVAELTGSQPAPAASHELGTLRISEVLAGPPGTRTAAVAIAQRGLLSSDFIAYRAGQKGIWFLRRGPADTAYFLADHPQRLMPASAADEVRRVVYSKRKGNPRP